MAKQSSKEEDINWDEIPPIGGLFIILFTAGVFLSIDFSGDMLTAKAITLLGSFLGVCYFGLRFNQLYHEDGLKKSIQWIFTAPADRKKNEFSSPDLGAMMPDGSPDLNGMIPERKKTETQEGMTLKKLRSMDNYEFEKLVAEVWQEMGFETKVTQASNDRGVDVIAEKDHVYHEKKIIQAKRYAEGNKIGSEQVQRYDSLRRQEDNVDEVIIVTTSSFTKPAKRTAKDLNVKPIDGNNFLELYQENMEKQKQVAQ